MDPLPPRLVLFDGVCGLCDRSVQWLLDHDTEGRLRFAPLQGPTAQAVLVRHPELPRGIDSILFVESEGSEERITYRSRAMLRICRELPSPWRALSSLRVVPAPLSDVVYRFVARIRYRVWGRREACRVPSAEERSRFLD